MTEKQKQKKPEPNLFEGSYIKFRPADGEVIARFHIPDGIMDEDRFWILKAIDSAIFNGVQKALEMVTSERVLVIVGGQMHVRGRHRLLDAVGHPERSPEAFQPMVRMHAQQDLDHGLSQRLAILGIEGHAHLSDEFRNG